jgi:hypothetical protein
MSEISGKLKLLQLGEKDALKYISLLAKENDAFNLSCTLTISEKMSAIVSKCSSFQYEITENNEIIMQLRQDFENAVEKLIAERSANEVLEEQCLNLSKCLELSKYEVEKLSKLMNYTDEKLEQSSNAYNALELSVNELNKVHARELVKQRDKHKILVADLRTEINGLTQALILSSEKCIKNDVVTTTKVFEMSTEIDRMRILLDELVYERDNATSRATSLELELKTLESQFTRLQSPDENVIECAVSKEASIVEDLRKSDEENEFLFSDINRKSEILGHSIVLTEYQDLLSQNSLLRENIDSLSLSFEEEKLKFTQISEKLEFDVRELKLREHTLCVKLNAGEQQIDALLFKQLLQGQEQAEIMEAINTKESHWALECAKNEAFECESKIKYTELEGEMEHLKDKLSKTLQEKEELRLGLNFSVSQVDDLKKHIQENVNYIPYDVNVNKFIFYRLILLIRNIIGGKSPALYHYGNH